MLIIMAGYPKSGKSTFLDILKKSIPQLIIVRPSDWYPPDLDSMPNPMEYKLASWEYAVEKAQDLLMANSVALDTCGASPNSLGVLIESAKMHKHKVYVIFIDTPFKICADRGGHDIVAGYTKKFIAAIPEYKSRCDRMYVVKYDTIQNWEIVAKKMAGELCI